VRHFHRPSSLPIDTKNLISTFGESIEIIKTGLLNTNQGPDFFNAQLKINGQTLIGNIEIHLRNEDWYKHQHQKDERYNNTILHVVYNPTNEIYTLTKNNQKISTHISKLLRKQSVRFINKKWSKSTKLFLKYGKKFIIKKILIVYKLRHLLTKIQKNKKIFITPL
jgi:hypothetical protein